MLKRFAPVWVLCGALVVGAAAFMMTASDADDGMRTTYLGVKPHDFDGTGAVDALVASVDSIDPNDLSASIDIYWTVPGGTERHGVEASTARIAGDPPLALSHAILASEFPSGTAVRAVFNVKNTTGQTWSFARTATVP